jgi:conjugal transfer pilus assembly protein TraU
MNPISDVNWEEIFPIRVAGITVAAGGTYDTPDMASSTICTCPLPPPVYRRTGVPVSYWEPARLVEVVKTPYYFPTIGRKLNIGRSAGAGLGANSSQVEAGPGNARPELSFVNAHYFAFPVWSIVGLIVDGMCVEAGSGFDVLYLTEVDPLWSDDSLALYIAPEALLFANPLTEMICMIDAASVNIYTPLDILFWCIGSGGYSYPMTGNVLDAKANDTASTAAARMIYKLSREFLVCDPGIWYCSCVSSPIWKKTNYKLHTARPSREPFAWPIGKSSLFRGPVNPPIRGAGGPEGEFLWVLFRKHICCAY